MMSSEHAAAPLRASGPGSELEALRAVIDALEPVCCLLDSDGVILLVNRSWTRIASGSGAPAGHWVGMSYLAVCGRAEGTLSEGAPEASIGIRSILEGERVSFSLVYPCQIRGEPRWFEFRASGVEHWQARVLISHEDVTERERYRRDAMGRFGTLSAREREVLSKLVGGSTSKEIANALGIAPNTVENHRASILKKSRATNTADLVRLAVSAELSGAHPAGQFGSED